MVMCFVSCNDNPFMSEWNTPFGIPPFEKIQDKHYLPAVEEGIRQHNAEIAAIVDNPQAPTFENTVVAYEYSGDLLNKVLGVFFNISESDGTPAIQELEGKILPMVTTHYDEILLNAGLYKRVEALYAKKDSLSLNSEQLRVLDKLYQSFVRNGIALPLEQQEEMKKINARLSELTLRFGQNLLSENNAFKSKFGISISQYSQQMSVCEDRAQRQAMFEAYSSRAANGGENDNNKILLETMQLRQRQAALLGFATPAEFVLDVKMAKNSKTVDAFLDGIMPAAIQGAKKERALLQEAMNLDIKNGKLPKASKIQAWDWFYYADQVRKSRYSLDEEAVKPYFKAENVRAGVFENSSRLYGISFKPIEGVALYHPEVEAFEVLDADGSHLGVILTDYFPRETKRGGAWMNDFVPQRILPSGVNQRPVVVNVCNFSRPCLSIDDVETLFHEFGHALHSLLSQATYPSLAGTNVKRDFVELPSQVHENWAFQKELLTSYAHHIDSGEVIPDALVQKINAAALFNEGFRTTELTAAAILDMAWHQFSSMKEFADFIGASTLEKAGLSQWDYTVETLSDEQASCLVKAFESKVCKEMGLIDEIIPRYRSTYFNHVFGGSGYNAGYYNYLWAEVLDKDAFSLFMEKGLYDKETAMSFRRNILEKGDTEDPMVLYRRFRGGDPDPDALLKARGLK
ncbi:MAG: M3 family metallopeptidase [Bacteroidales bacterium]|nr:M3 family metallopeptidase [Bacteroidales bacterium]